MTSPTITIPAASLFSSTTAIDSLCIGSGRFLRSVLVPALVAANYRPAIIQTRGRTFLDYCCGKDTPTQIEGEGENEFRSWTYEVDTVHFDGRIETINVPFWGAGTLGNPEGKKDILELCSKLGSSNNGDKPLIIGVGVTEAGLSSSSTKAMKDLYDIFVALSKREHQQKICVINTDNVSKNGNVIQTFMVELAESDEAMQTFLTESVVFHNTMVDRITSQRPGSDGFVPRAEPTPLKALVIEDLRKALPSCFAGDTLRKEHGVVIRTVAGKLDADIALKLRIANGIHTAAAHAMALSGLVTTDVLSPKTDTIDLHSGEVRLLMNYLDSFFEHQILNGVEATTEFEASRSDAQAVYEDWRRRLCHAHFGLSTFFITQNGAAKGGIRIGPTIKDLILSSQPIQCSTVFALAAILIFLSPASVLKRKTAGNVWVGTLDSKRNTEQSEDIKLTESGTATYADGLTYNLIEGRYDFRCDCDVNETPLPKVLCSIDSGSQPIEYEDVVRSYLCKPNGGNLSSVADTPAFKILVKAVAALYARIRGGDAILDILRDLDLEASCECLVDGE